MSKMREELVKAVDDARAKGNKMKKFTLVPTLIDWVDSRLPSNKWEHVTDLTECTICHCLSVGFVVQEDKEMIALASSVADTDKDLQATGIIVIPKVSILLRQLLCLP